MKRILVPMVAAVGLLATDHSGVKPRTAAKNYPAYDNTEGCTIAAAVLPGICVGDDSVVGGRAVVVRDLPAHVVARGVPARVA